ncbi:hypothetical protein TGAMA5MH_03359 [Trichoderma gamsii]|uniref:Uncharacterized protein n=1 Tax=Trichoderma gamsii TaxID=398673 RepID=A0A2K0THE5_9HYPO|nr:hypothetical protein TGAMA5MH_03359 [Trichoderma gamsii]
MNPSTFSLAGAHTRDPSRRDEPHTIPVALFTLDPGGKNLIFVVNLAMFMQ